MFSPDFILLGVYGLALTVAVGALLAACVTDFYTMTIPNILPALLAAAFVVAYGAGWGISHGGGEVIFAPLHIHALAFGLMLFVTFLMFAFGIWGAGDSKLAAAIALWIGLAGIVPFFITMSLAGLALILGNFVFSRTRFAIPGCGERSWVARVRRGERILPYGIAIAIGAISAFAACGYFGWPG